MERKRERERKLLLLLTELSLSSMCQKVLRSVTSYIVTAVLVPQLYHSQKGKKKKKKKKKKKWT